jgi:hypothetical protein
LLHDPSSTEPKVSTPAQILLFHMASIPLNDGTRD